MTQRAAEEIVNKWRARGEPLAVAGANSVIWREGRGEPVVCLHGVPASAFLYRKVLPALATHGLEGIAFDLPGLGFAERPRNFDYRWSALARWSLDALNAAGVDRFHLVVHDIGGPIGFELARLAPARIRSLTALNTFVYSASFRRPWVMEPFAHRGIGSLWLSTTRTPMLIALMRMIGVHDGCSDDEIRAYGLLLNREDGGRAFLQMMRSFERTRPFEERTLAALRARAFPAQVIWGAEDPALKLGKFGPEVRDVLRAPDIYTVRGKHFLQEDSPTEIARKIAELSSAA